MEERERTTDAVNAFEEIYKACSPEVYKYVYRRIQNREAAEDIVQEVFYTAWEAKENFMEHPDQMGWLIRTAKNKLCEHGRKMKYRISESLEERESELAVEETDYAKIETELTALSLLKREKWELLKEYHVLGTPIGELAERHGITENNMRVRLCRYRAELQEKMNIGKGEKKDAGK